MTTPVFYVDARDDLNASAANKERLALNHFNHFIKTYCVQIGIDAVVADAIPYRGIPRKSSDKAVLEFWDLMIGAFITYMGNHARIGCNPEAERLKRGSAAQYCSSVKGFFVNKFRNEPAIPVFQDKQWSKLMTKLRGKYREANRAAGKPAVEGNESSTREDREWMATGCIWDGTAETAEFWHLLNTSYHCSGRCSEVSLVKPEDIRALEVNECIHRYDILQCDVQRQKDGPLQSIAIYPHRDGVLEDYYFSLIYLIVMTGCNNRFVLPTFSSAALKTKSGKSNSQGLLWYWVASVQGRFSRLARGDDLERWSPAETNSPREGPASYKASVVKWPLPKPQDQAKCFNFCGQILRSQYEHFMGHGKPWTKRFKWRDITEANKLQDARTYWLFILRELNDRYQAGLDLDHLGKWKGAVSYQVEQREGGPFTNLLNK